MTATRTYRLPAEWEPQSGVQLTWPHAGTDWAPMLDEVLQTYDAIAGAIERYEPVLSVGQPNDDTWARDHGFITLIDDSETENSESVNSKSVNRKSPGVSQIVNSKSVNSKLLDFKFNGWGEKFPAEQDNAINRRLYDAGCFRGEYVDHLDFVLEGGSIESDGRGTIFTTSHCLMAPHRNQPLGRAEIEQRLKDWLCANRVLWIDYGRLTGDDTDGHIDTLVRICPDDTLLYVGCDDPDDEQYRELQLMEQQLRTFRTIDGQPYRLRKLPMPRPIVDDGERLWEGVHPHQGERLPATYANFLVVNGAVLCPTYGQPDLDEAALRVIGETFPGRDIVGIDCRTLIRQHGSLHCCTMQFPEGVICNL